ncbi:MAG: 30S ribosomal protein S9 [Simkaniaceae bacterium]|nr:30S ribosomal protein S9 [Simkaniaceae bacterium]
MAKTLPEELLGVGRRKRAVASVRLRRGTGKFDVNGRRLEDYFLSSIQRETVLAPFEKLGMVGQFDVIVRAKGGGISGQMIAVRLGIARALVKGDEERRAPLKQEGYLTRDPRKRERKKYGLAGARKRFQFSKR